MTKKSKSTKAQPKDKRWTKPGNRPMPAQRTRILVDDMQHMLDGVKILDLSDALRKSLLLLGHGEEVIAGAVLNVRSHWDTTTIDVEVVEIEGDESYQERLKAYDIHVAAYAKQCEEDAVRQKEEKHALYLRLKEEFDSGS